MKTPTTLALGDDVRAALDQLAEREERSRSWIANKLLRDGLTARGQQPPPHATDNRQALACGGE